LGCSFPGEYLRAHEVSRQKETLGKKRNDCVWPSKYKFFYRKNPVELVCGRDYVKG